MKPHYHFHSDMPNLVYWFQHYTDASQLKSKYLTRKTEI